MISVPAPPVRLVLVLLSLTGVARGDVVLNEVLYDPAGADGGHEFVELHNTGVSSIDLTDWRLQFANGAVGDVWSTRWIGRSGDAIAPGGRFLIVDQGWSGTPADAVASLGLQNGPDGLRLLDALGVVDLLGWGALDHPALYEGTPHPGAGGGAALARRPDGRDTDDNAADWRVLADPTPGEPNYPPFGLMVAGYAAEPPSLAAPGPAVRVALACVNAGVDTLPAARVVLCDGTGRELAALDAAALPPAAEQDLVFDWTPVGEARHALRLRRPASPADTLEVPFGGYRCGPAPLILTEVMAAPASGACEWVEIAAAGAMSVDLDGYALVDAGGAPSPLPARILAAGERLLLVQDAADYESWWLEQHRIGAPLACPDVEPHFNAVELDGAWPTLNNTPPEGRDYADRVHLLDPGGTVADHVTVGDAGAPVSIGRSLERGGPRPAGHPSALWGPSTATAGATPGCVNSREAEPAAVGAFTAQVQPPELGEGVGFSFDLHDNERAWSVVIYDLAGFVLRNLGGDALGSGPRRVVWDGRDEVGGAPPPEPLVALLTVYGADGARARTERLLVVTADAAGR